MKIAITGHRPNKLGNDYALTSPLIQAIKKDIINILDCYLWREGKVLQNNIPLPVELITGMALGIDTLFAQIAIENNIPFFAVVPFRGQHSKWSKSSQNTYFDILSKASVIQIVDRNIQLILRDRKQLEELFNTGNDYALAKMQKRNEWMIDNCDLLIAVWDGTNGGTDNCVKYAQSINKKIIIIDPNKYKS